MIQAATEWIEKAPRSAAPYAARARSWNDQEVFDKAIADATTALRLEPGDRDALYQLAEAHRGNGQHREAIEDLNALLVLEDDDDGRADVLRLRGWNYLQLNDHARALADQTRSIELQPRVAMVWSDRAATLRTRGQPGDRAAARDDLSRALKEDPRFAEAYLQAAALAEADRDTGEASALLERCIAIRPRFHEAYEQLAEMRSRAGDFAEATRVLERCVAAKPLSLVPFTRLSELYVRARDFPAARAILEQAIELGPKAGHTYVLLAKVDEDAGDFARAIQDEERLLARLEPGSTDAAETQQEIARLRVLLARREGVAPIRS